MLQGSLCVKRVCAVCSKDKYVAGWQETGGAVRNVGRDLQLRTPGHVECALPYQLLKLLLNECGLTVVLNYCQFCV